MSEGKRIHVSIGEVKIGDGQDTLMAHLGSCVGIGLLWKEKKLFGLAHCLLPQGLFQVGKLGGRFVNQALPSLLAMMKIRDENRESIEVILVGGGNMTDTAPGRGGGTIGELNAIAAQLLLKQGGFKITHLDVGGDAGRKIFIHCADGSFEVSNIPRLERKRNQE